MGGRGREIKRQLTCTRTYLTYSRQNDAYRQRPCCSASDSTCALLSATHRLSCTCTRTRRDLGQNMQRSALSRLHHDCSHDHDCVPMIANKPHQSQTHAQPTKTFLAHTPSPGSACTASRFQTLVDKNNSTNTHLRHGVGARVVRIDHDFAHPLGGGFGGGSD